IKTQRSFSIASVPTLPKDIPQGKDKHKDKHLSTQSIGPVIRRLRASSVTRRSPDPIVNNNRKSVDTSSPPSSYDSLPRKLSIPMINGKPTTVNSANSKSNSPKRKSHIFSRMKESASVFANEPNNSLPRNFSVSSEPIETPLQTPHGTISDISSLKTK